MAAGGGGGGPAGSGREHKGGGGNIGEPSTVSSNNGGGGIISDDDITSPLVNDDVKSRGDMPFDVMPLVIEDVMDDVIDDGMLGWLMDCKGREDGGGGGIASEGAPSGFRSTSVCLASSFISSASTFSSCKCFTIIGTLKKKKQYYCK